MTATVCGCPICVPSVDTPLHCGRDALGPVFPPQGSLWPYVCIWSLRCQALEPRLDSTRQRMEFEEQYFDILASNETVLTCVPQSQKGSLASLVSNSTHSAGCLSSLVASSSPIPCHALVSSGAAPHTCKGKGQDKIRDPA